MLLFFGGQLSVSFLGFEYGDTGLAFGGHCLPLGQPLLGREIFRLVETMFRAGGFGRFGFHCFFGAAGFHDRFGILAIFGKGPAARQQRGGSEDTE